MKACEKLDDLH